MSADSAVCQKFIEHINTLRTLRTSFILVQGHKKIRGSLLWKKPCFVRADMDDDQAPMTIIVNAEGSFVVNRAFNTVTKTDTRHHPLRQLLGSTLKSCDVELLSEECGYVRLRVAVCRNIEVLCDQKGRLVGWVVQGSRGAQPVFLFDMDYNGDVPEEEFETPRAPSALERRDFWARQKSMNMG